MGANGGGTKDIDKAVFLGGGSFEGGLGEEGNLLSGARGRKLVRELEQESPDRIPLTLPHPGGEASRHTFRACGGD